MRGYSCGNDSRARKKPPALLSQHDPFPRTPKKRGSKYIHTSIVLAVIVDHEHDFPLEDIVVDQAAAYSRNVFV